MLFQQATRKKLRFDSTKGKLSIEEVWDLPITSNTGSTSLDSLAVALDKKLSESGRTSFVNPTKKDHITQLQFDVVRTILETKLEERSQAALAKENKAKKDRLLEILADKQDEQLKGLSETQLKAMIRELS